MDNLLALDKACSILLLSSHNNNNQQYAHAYLSLAIHTAFTPSATNHHYDLLSSGWIHLYSNISPSSHPIATTIITAAIPLLYILTNPLYKQHGLLTIPPQMDPAPVLSLWIHFKAYEFPLFYSVLILVLHRPPIGLQKFLKAVLTSPSDFNTEQYLECTARWSSVFVNAARSWSASMFLSIVADFQSITDTSPNVSNPVALNLVLFACSGLLMVCPKSYTQPMFQYWTQLHTLVWGSTFLTSSTLDAFIYAVSSVSYTHPHLIIPITCANLLIDPFTWWLCTSVFAQHIPFTRSHDRFKSHLNTIIQILSRALISSPSRILPVLQSINNALVLIQDHLLLEPMQQQQQTPRVCLFLTVMLLQDLMHTNPIYDVPVLGEMLTMMMLVHKVALQATGFVPTSPPFQAWSDVLNALTQYIIQLPNTQFNSLLVMVLPDPMSDSGIAFIAYWLSSNRHNLLNRMPEWVLNRLGLNATSCTPPLAPIAQCAWEATHWLIVQVLEPSVYDMDPIRIVAQQWWPIYASMWFSSSTSPDILTNRSNELADTIKQRAAGALASACTDQDQVLWLLDMVASDFVCLACIANQVPIKYLMTVLGRVQAMGPIPQELTQRIANVWDVKGGIQWDRQIRLVQTFSRL